MKNWGIILLLLVALQGGWAMDTNAVKVLHKKLLIAPNHNSKAKLYIELSEECYDNRKSSLEYADSGWHYASAAGDSNLIRRALYRKAIIHEDQGKSTKSLPILFQLLREYKRLKMHQETIDVLCVLARHYRHFVMPEKALKYTMEAEQIADKNEGLEVGKIHKALGELFSYKSLYQQALEEFHKAIDEYKKEGDSLSLARTYLSIGKLYLGLNKPKKTKEYVDNAISLYQQLHSLDGLGFSYLFKYAYQSRLNNISEAFICVDSALYYRYLMYKDTTKYFVRKTVQRASLYEKNKEYRTALTLFKYCVDVYFETSDKFHPKDADGWLEMRYKHIPPMYMRQVSCYFQLASYDSAMYCLDSALHFNQYSKVLDSSSVAYWRSKIYEARNQTDSALKYFKEYNLLKDEQEEKEGRDQLAFLETRFQNQKLLGEVDLWAERNKVSELKIAKTNAWFIAAGILAVLVVTLIVFYNRRKQSLAKRNALELKHRLLQTQMNPHFIFNSLNSIQTLIFEDNKRGSTKYLTKFSKLLRSILESSREDLISLEQELEIIENYLTLEQLRFKDRLEYSIEYANDLEIDELYLPPFLLQPLVENALKHGFAHMDGVGKLQLTIEQKPKHLMIIIDDNGMGRAKAKELKQKTHREHKSFATQILQERISSFNQKGRGILSFEIEDKMDGNGNPLGTRVIVHLPIIDTMIES